VSGHTALVLGDQLMRDNPALDGAARVVFVESLGGLRRVRTHRRRVHLVLSGMRHFAAELRAAGDVEVVEHRGVASLGEALAAERDVVCAEPNVAGAGAGCSASASGSCPPTSSSPPPRRSRTGRGAAAGS
jgi:deoxyribodipyrimidine photolyase-related protein